MTTTAHEDQFRSEPDLESECRKARAKALDVCVWVTTNRSTCLGEWTFGNMDDDMARFRFCPLCGKKIKVEKEAT